MNVTQDRSLLSSDPNIRAGLFNRLSSGSGIDAVIGEAAHGIGSTLGLIDAMRLENAEQPRIVVAGHSTYATSIPNPSPRLTQQQADQAFGVPGFLDFKDYPNGIIESAAKILHDMAIAQATRQEVLSRADNTLTAKTERAGAHLLTSMLDPIGLGASLVPGIGEARGVWLTTRLGKPLGRLVEGVASGAMGNAAVEPLALLQARSEHLDYTAYDSLKSTLFGAGLGVVLHLMFGRTPTAEMVDALTPEQHEALLRGALDDMAEPRPVDVGQLIGAEQYEALPRGAIEDKAEARPADVGQLVGAEQNAAARAPKWSFDHKDNPLLLLEPARILAAGNGGSRKVLKRRSRTVLKKRSGWKGRGALTIVGKDVGSVQFNWHHADVESASAKDVLALQGVFRDDRTLFLDTGSKRHWLIERPGGRFVLYTARRSAESGKIGHIVDIHVVRDEEGLKKLVDSSDFARTQPPVDHISTDSSTYQASRTEGRNSAEGDNALAAFLRDAIARKRRPHINPTEAAVSSKAADSLAKGPSEPLFTQATALDGDVAARESWSQALSSTRTAVEHDVTSPGHGISGAVSNLDAAPLQSDPQLSLPLDNLFPSTRNKRYTTNPELRRRWEELHKRPWPRTKFLGRRLEVHHKIALADGGLDRVSNIEPMGRAAHNWHHRQNGDFARWSRLRELLKAKTRGSPGLMPSQ